MPKKTPKTVSAGDDADPSVPPTPRMLNTPATLSSDVETKLILTPIVEAPRTSDTIIPKVIEAYLKRDNLMRCRGDAARRVLSLCKRIAGYNPMKPEDERKVAEKAAEEAFKQLMSGKPESEVAKRSFLIVDTLIEQIGRYDDAIRAVEKVAVHYAMQSPGAQFVEATKGFGPIGLVMFIGECGDLANYGNPAKVWKRMGLAPYQGRAASTWRMQKVAGLTAEQWTEVGYSPKRRSASYQVGDSLLKCSSGPYKSVYDQRKAFEVQKFAAAGKPVLGLAEAKSAKLKPGDYTPKMHAHRRAQRYTEKRLLRDLWRAWTGKAEEYQAAA